MHQVQQNSGQQTEWHMQWNTWNEQEGELSARERLIAILAFKIANNRSLTQEESAAQLYRLPDEDIFAVLKMVALFSYWQQLASAQEGDASEAQRGVARERLASD